MKFFIAITFAISFSLIARESNFVQPEGTICAGWKFKIEPDMQITDDDLTLDNVKDSLTWLNNNIDKQGVLYGYGKANRLKVVQGYIFKSDYLTSHPDDKEYALNNYCNWLKSEGFWYD